MTYYRWMEGRYKYEDTPAGKLAQDMKHDLTFPRKAGRSDILEYLIRKNASASCIRAFDETWREYTKSGHAVKRERTGRYGYSRTRKHHWEGGYRG